MQQLRAFDQSKGGSKAGYCLQNVRLGFSIPALYNDAWTAWRNTDQRTGAIPTGVDVPLYYDYTDRNGNRYGHINVRLKDGRIWNDGRYFQSMQTFQSSMSNVKYVGWSTAINNVKVIGESDMITKDDTDAVRIVMSEVEGWNGHDIHSGKNDAQIMGAWTGKKWTDFIRNGWKVQKTKRIHLEESLATMTKHKNIAESTVAEQNKALSIKDNEIASLKAQVGDSTKWNTFKVLIKELIGVK